MTRTELATASFSATYKSRRRCPAVYWKELVKIQDKSPTRVIFFPPMLFFPLPLVRPTFTYLANFFYVLWYKRARFLSTLRDAR